jgi:aryl-alcohol dehydrogenase-like predicted oxidoreductase
MRHVQEREMIPYCKAHGIGLIPYSVLAGGNLTRPVDEQSLRSQTNKGTAFEYKLTDADKAIIGRVQEVAEKKGCMMSQVALAVRQDRLLTMIRRSRATQWVQLKVNSPIIGLGSVKNVERSAEKGVELTPEEAKYLEEL